MDPAAHKHCLIILVRGLPGSGKSYLTQPLAAAIEEFDDQPVVTLDPDATDYDSPAYHDHVQQQIAAGVDPALHAYRFLRAQAYAAIETGQTVIWNQPFTNLEIFNKMVGRFQEHATSVGSTVMILVVEVNADPAVARQRVSERKAAGGHGPSAATFDRFVRDYQSFAPHDYQTVAVQGDATADESITKIMASVRNLLQA